MLLAVRVSETQSTIKNRKTEKMKAKNLVLFIATLLVLVFGTGCAGYRMVLTDNPYPQPVMYTQPYGYVAYGSETILVGTAGFSGGRYRGGVAAVSTSYSVEQRLVPLSQSCNNGGGRGQGGGHHSPRR